MGRIKRSKVLLLPAPLATSSLLPLPLLRGPGGPPMAKFLHCVHTAHAEAGILTQEYPSPV